MVRCGWMKEKDSDRREGGCFVEGFISFPFVGISVIVSWCGIILGETGRRIEGESDRI